MWNRRQGRKQRNKSLGVHPVEVGETLCQALDKLVVSTYEDQSKMACGNLYMCACLEASIDGAIYAVGQRQRERAVRSILEEYLLIET